ncbi:hypothetical protein [Amycolatopsis palatopharyngis]|uniref:hypothetical protein n=1 Tax=Amycolatopsis palatopharyngis TaxID=187982 RepID=UPI000E235F65|nr:hypothetical protein [Amycolatopsis palatopharyngis]
MTTPDESDDQRRADGLPPAPRMPGDAPRVVDPPKLVNVSFGLWIASGVAMVLGYVVTLVNKDEIVAQLLEISGNNEISEEQLASGTTSFLWAALVGAIAFAVMFALFAYKAREGTRSARTVLTVLAVITMLFQLLLFGHRLFGSLSALLAAIAVVLLYLPSVTGYFPKIPKSLS